MNRQIKSFARRERSLTKTQKEIFKSLDLVELKVSDGKIDLSNIFKREAPTNLEIGFGMGDSLGEIALKNSNKNYIGIEVYRPGIVALLAMINKYKLTNIRIYSADAVQVVNMCIPDNSLSKVMIFFPDPWPKRRHHKRRIIQTKFIESIHAKLKNMGCLHVATDCEDYADHILKVVGKFDGFDNVAKNHKFIERPRYRPITKFENRGIMLGHGVKDIIFIKKPSRLTTTLE